MNTTENTTYRFNYSRQFQEGRNLAAQAAAMHNYPQAMALSLVALCRLAADHMAPAPTEQDPGDAKCPGCDEVHEDIKVESLANLLALFGIGTEAKQ